MRYIPSKQYYQVFISLDDTKDTAGSLLKKNFKSKVMAYCYYRILNYILTHKKITYIENLIERFS